MHRRRGFTLIELLVVIAIIALLIGLLLPALAKAKRNATSLKDQTQVAQIHRSMQVWANDNKGILPLPGLINRQQDIWLQKQVPGSGPEDETKNVSRHLYSAMIAQEFFNTDIVISPAEQNPLINEFTSYDYAAYNPSADSYWDGDNTGPNAATFDANIEGRNDGVSNTSYFHTALLGERKRTKWRAEAKNTDPVLGSRAPFHGRGETGGDPGELANYRDSYTLLMHGPKRQWVGNIVFGDNHTEVVDTFRPASVAYEPPNGRLEKDNIFAPFPEGDDAQPESFMAGDAFLTMVRLQGSGGSNFGEFQEKLVTDQ